MRKMRPSLRLLLAATACLAWLGTGCQTSTQSPASATVTATPSYYRGQNLPAQVDNLSGTPLYSTSEDLAKNSKITGGAPFLLIAPQNPSQALLVIESGSSAAQLSVRPSNLGDFAGTTEALEAPELVTQVKDAFGLELKTDESGKVVVLRLQGAPATPVAGATP